MNSQSRPVILVVDDDAAVLNSLTFMLETEGFDVRALGDVGELLLAETIPDPDCLVVDYRMPVMNGFDVLYWLRDKKVTAPAILITGHPDPKLHERALAAGFSCVVEKSLLGATLTAGIREVIAGHRIP